jgi:hypothetical protein
VRYPSGQLPQNIEQLTMAVGSARPPTDPGDTVQDAPGQIQGNVDEVITTQELEPSIWDDAEQGRYRSNMAPPGTQVPTMSPTDTTWSPGLNVNSLQPPDVQRGRTIRLDDEYVVATNTAADDAGQNFTVVRGMLATLPAQHGRECNAWFDFPFPRVAVTAGTFSLPHADMIPLRKGCGNWINARDFYVGVDRGGGKGVQEVLPIKYRNGDVLDRPRDRFDNGCFRSSFGSGRLSPELAANDVIFDWPFRFEDRYAVVSNSIEGVFFEATEEIPGAFFDRVTWDATLPNGFSQILVQVRVDGVPDWSSQVQRKDDFGVPGKLYQFDDPKADNKIQVAGDRVEVRVYMTFKPGAFYDVLGPWLATPYLKAIHLTYRQPTRVIRREELPR